MNYNDWIKDRNKLWTDLAPLGITRENCWGISVAYRGYKNLPPLYILSMKVEEGYAPSETDPYLPFYFSDSEDEEEHLRTRQPLKLSPSLDPLREKLEKVFPGLKLIYKL